MRYYLDTEFIERPCTIDLISVALVAEDGRELYCVSSEFDESRASDWVRENVIAKLGDTPRDSRDAIRQHVLDFVGEDPKPEFWGYYADYDWVVLCWLFGTMMELPKGWPMYCRDLKQLADSLGNPKLPPNDASEHNALADARWKQGGTLLSGALLTSRRLCEKRGDSIQPCKNTSVAPAFRSVSIANQFSVQ